MRKTLQKAFHAEAIKPYGGSGHTTLQLSDHVSVPLLQVIVTAGVAIASYGELTLVVLGVILQLAAVATESTRLILVQILLQVWSSSVLWCRTALGFGCAADLRSDCTQSSAQQTA